MNGKGPHLYVAPFQLVLSTSAHAMIQNVADWKRIQILVEVTKQPVVDLLKSFTFFSEFKWLIPGQNSWQSERTSLLQKKNLNK